MNELEKVLFRALTDPGFIDLLKKEDYDPSKEYRLDDQEKEILKQIRLLHQGKGLDTFVQASSEAMRHLMPRLMQCVTPETRHLGHYDFLRVAPKLERVAPKLERVAPKLERVEPKLSRVEPKLSRVEPKLSKVEPKLGRVEPKLCKVEAKLSRIEAKLERVEKKSK